MRWLPVERVTIILAVDRRLRLILGYKIIFRREANADDVLDALNSAVGNDSAKVACDGVEIDPGFGLPRELKMQPVHWTCWLHGNGRGEFIWLVHRNGLISSPEMAG